MVNTTYQVQWPETDYQYRATLPGAEHYRILNKVLSMSEKTLRALDIGRVMGFNKNGISDILFNMSTTLGRDVAKFAGSKAFGQL